MNIPGRARAASLDRAVRALREPRAPAAGPGRKDGKLEREIFPDGSPRVIGTVYLRNGECPLACVYCALYRTSDERAATGAGIARQIEAARRAMPGIAGLKLYNASSLFEAKSIRQTPEDLAAIARAVADLDLVVVEARSENAGRAAELAPLLRGRLEVAIGLEVADDELLALMNKPTTVARFRRSARALRESGILLRAFVLVQPPFIAGAAARELALRAFELAAAEGARVVSLLPVVSNHRPMERLRREGFFSEIGRDAFFDIVRDCAGRGPVVVAELEAWERLPGCANCGEAKRRELQRLNETGRLSPISCADHRPVESLGGRRPSAAEVAEALRG